MYKLLIFIVDFNQSIPDQLMIEIKGVAVENKSPDLT